MSLDGRFLPLGAVEFLNGSSCHWAQIDPVSAGARRRPPIAAHGVWMYGASTPARRSNRRLAAASSPWAQHRRQSSPDNRASGALTRYGSLPRLLAKEVCHIAGSLIRRKERDDHLSQSAASLGFQPVPHLRQNGKFSPRCAGAVSPARAERSYWTGDNMRRKIRIVDVRERGGAQLGVFHRATLPAVGCGHPWDNAYR